MARVVTRYGLVAVPVVDEGRRLVGVITVADALWDVLPEDWRHEMPRRIRAGSLAAGGPIELPAKPRPRTKGATKGGTKVAPKSKVRAKRGATRG